MNLALKSDLPQNTCTHTELLELDQTLCYTAIANDTLFHLLSNRTIAPAIKLWIFIRVKQSGFKDREKISISVAELSKALAVGRSTIQNWQRILISEGYLEVIERRASTRSNLTNLYRACLPAEVQVALSESNRRAAPRTKVKASTQKPQEKKTSKKKDNGKVYVGIQNNRNSQGQRGINPGHAHRSIPEHQRAKIQNALEQERVPNWVKLLCAGLALKQDEKGNLIVIDAPDHAKKPIEQAFADTAEHMVKILPNYVGGIIFTRNNLSREEAPNYREGVDSKTTDFNSAPTAAGIPQHTYLRLRKRLASLEHNDRPLFTPNQVDQLSNEVLYAVTTGTFSNLPTAHAINIALKLVRENRWTTPHFFTNRV